MRGKIIIVGYCIVVTCLSIVWYLFSYEYNILEPTIHIEKRIDYEEPTIQPKTKLFNTDFEYLINNRVCELGNKDILAVIIVTSYYGNVETRSAMRRAFSQEELIAFNMRRVFLIALPPESDKSMNPKAIQNENERFGDLIQGNFIEAYRNLTYKHTMGLKWAAEYCKNTKYIIKMDDDIVVNIYKISEFLLTSKLNKNMSIAGYILKGMVPIREPANKWFVTQFEYPKSYYPPFLSGWFYITTPKVAEALTKLTSEIPYFWIDDVYITGILAKKLKLKHEDLSAIFAVHPEYLQCCMQDLKKFKFNCPIIVGPNGGDNNLFFTYNEVMSKCYYEPCKERTKNKGLNQTCVAEWKSYIGHGKALIESVKL